MSKLFKFFIEKFLTKQFFTFVIIGFINTAINFAVLWGCEKLFSYLYTLITASPLVATSLISTIFRIISVTIAFVVATIFSYYANSRFAFGNKEYSFKKLFETISVLLIRLLIVIVLTEIVVVIFRSTNINDYFTKETSDSIANLLASIIMIPAAYLVLEKILKKESGDSNEADIN